MVQAREASLESKRAHKSFRYRTKTTWSSGRRGILSAAGKPNIVVGSPPEFKGEPDNWSPEELLVASLNTCTMLTFLTLSQAQGLSPAGYETVAGKHRITKVMVQPRVTLRSTPELETARKIMDAVEGHCFISNSISAEVTITPEFIVAQPGQ